MPWWDRLSPNDVRHEAEWESPPARPSRDRRVSSSVGWMNSDVPFEVSK
jgi:hypothetical protein